MSKDRKILALIHNLFPDRSLVRLLAAQVEFMPKSDLFVGQGCHKCFSVTLCGTRIYTKCNKLFVGPVLKN